MASTFGLRKKHDKGQRDGKREGGSEREREGGREIETRCCFFCRSNVDRAYSLGTEQTTTKKGLYARRRTWAHQAHQRQVPRPNQCSPFADAEEERGVVPFEVVDDGDENETMREVHRQSHGINNVNKDKTTGGKSIHAQQQNAHTKGASLPFLHVIPTAL